MRRVLREGPRRVPPPSEKKTSLLGNFLLFALFFVKLGEKQVKKKYTNKWATILQANHQWKLSSL